MACTRWFSDLGELNRLPNIDINKLSVEVEAIKSNRIYENAFEWRFEFPEVKLLE